MFSSTNGTFKSVAQWIYKVKPYTVGCCERVCVTGGEPWKAPCLTFVCPWAAPLPPGPQSQLVCCSGRSWCGPAAAVPPIHPILLSALEFTPDQQPLHFTLEFSIFYFLSLSSTAHPPRPPRPPSFPLPPPTHSFSYTNHKTSGALKPVAGWWRGHPHPASDTTNTPGISG